MQLKSSASLFFMLLCGCNNAGAFVAHHRSTIAAMGRLHYKSNPEDDDSPPQFSFDTINNPNDDSSSTTSSSRPPPRRSFLHQLDRFLTILQGTSAHLKRHTFLSGNFAPVSEEHVQVPVEVVEGQIPEGLDGAFCRNGPNPVIGWQKKRYHWVSKVQYDCSIETVACIVSLIHSFLLLLAIFSISFFLSSLTVTPCYTH